MVDIISIVDGIINQLITWGAPPCTKSDFMPSSVHGTLRNGRSTWFALAQTSACKGKRFIKGTPLLSLLPLIGFVQGYVNFAGKVWFLAGKKGWSANCPFTHLMGSSHTEVSSWWLKTDLVMLVCSQLKQESGFKFAATWRTRTIIDYKWNR